MSKTKKQIHPAYHTKFQVDQLVRDCKNLQATVRHQAKELEALRAVSQLVVASWERGDLASAIRQLAGLVSDGNVAFPWCVACQSWHHPNNPTCFKLTGQVAQVRRP